MTAIREAIVVPLIFLTVTLLGGLRVGTGVALVPPPVVAVVLGGLFVGALVRAGVMRPNLLVNGGRTILENVGGAIVAISALSASAQVFNVITPETGLLHLLFAAFFFMQILTTLAGVSGPRHLLRAVAVMLGCAFVLRWIVLENLYASGSGTAKRMLTLLVEGISLGAIDYQSHQAVTGYVALLTIALFLVGLWLLTAPSHPSQSAMVVVHPRTGDLVVVLLVVSMTVAGCRAADGDAPAPMAEAKADSTRDRTAADKDRARRMRDAALRSASVWHQPAVPIPQVNLADNPQGAGSFRVDEEVTCRFVIEKVGGTTPKFNCELAGGDIVRVKYGTSNPEIHAEVAATRLLAALGFPADRMFVVKRVKCLGCPKFPFQALKCLDDTGLESACFAGGLDYSQVATFDPAVIERRHHGEKIEAVENQGWAWYELDQIDPAHGGSTRAEVDALRLMAVLLAHWDNKAENQRLVCPSGNVRPDGSCVQPLALIQDLGATFGPLKVDLGNWRRTPIWADRATCTVSMEDLPYKGSTFPKRRISEAGRRMVLRLLEQLSERQLADLFDASRITTYDQVDAAARRSDPWVRAFNDKVRQMREGGPCPQ